MNDVLAAERNAFIGVRPWEGFVPHGYMADFAGVLIDLRFRKNLGVDPSASGGEVKRMELPTLATYNEGFFEVLNWAESARVASGRYVMMSLGACFGLQAVGCYKMLQAINPMPAKLVLVEPEPGNVAWIHQHLKDNGIDPADHWIVPMALSDTNVPALFPIGSPGTGSHNCISTNHPSERRKMFQLIVREGDAVKSLENLLVHNTTGLTRDISSGQGLMAEVGYVSCVTMADLLAPFERVDFIEADLQMSELVAFPPYMDLFRKKVKRFHIGTHGEQGHVEMRKLFGEAGWEVLFDFEPFKIHETNAGKLFADDGILTVRNPDL